VEVVKNISTAMGDNFFYKFYNWQNRKKSKNIVIPEKYWNINLVSMGYSEDSCMRRNDNSWFLRVCHNYIMRYNLKYYFLLLIPAIMLIISCQQDKDFIQKGYWVENDAENSLVRFTEDGRFINIRNPESNIRYKIDGNEMILRSDKDVYSLKIKSASDMEFVIGNDKEDFTFFRATPADFFYGIWHGQGESDHLEFSFAEKSNGYLTINYDTTKHIEFFTYQLINSEIIIYKQDKTIDTVVFNFSDDLNMLKLINKNGGTIELERFLSI
jgi:hypothetical protein